MQSEKRPSADDNVTKRLFLYGLDEVVALGDCNIEMEQHLSIYRHWAGDNALHALNQGTHESQPSIKLDISGHRHKQSYGSIPKCSKADRSTPN